MSQTWLGRSALLGCALALLAGSASALPDVPPGGGNRVCCTNNNQGVPFDSVCCDDGSVFGCYDGVTGFQVDCPDVIDADVTCGGGLAVPETCPFSSDADGICCPNQARIGCFTEPVERKTDLVCSVLNEALLEDCTMTPSQAAAVCETLSAIALPAIEPDDQWGLAATAASVVGIAIAIRSRAVRSGGKR